eukprot:TRINITY_DN1378_c0_g3_i1.p1 TRINITY_DN1378_c0_g3~~TRINITY_DN1378_c0_g3_i1.p1  ORF type:complete len:129 (+),score=14.60 TRINITY_DN1378_c0_g3_i1:107-493(+)
MLSIGIAKKLTRYEVPPLSACGGCPLLDWSDEDREEWLECDDDVPEGNRNASLSMATSGSSAEEGTAQFLSATQARSQAIEALSRQRLLSLHPAVLHELSKQCGQSAWNKLTWTEKFQIAQTQLGITL